MSAESVAQAGKDLSDAATELVNDTLGNANETFKATPGGQAVAYSSLILMALLPIFYGSFRSIQKPEEKEKRETITKNDAMQFPLVASGMLLSIYVIFKVFSQEYINIAIAVYFFVLGLYAMTHLATPLVKKFVPGSFPNIPYRLHFVQGEGDTTEDLLDWSFSRSDLLTLLVCAVIAAWYALQKHWIANNMIGLALAVNGVELLQLNSIVTGCILLCGLFVYDVFWVFGTNVMVTVAKNFNAPIKVVFPQDFLDHGVFGKQLAMLGLGDIVIPGIFIALLLRFDMSLKRGQKTYFYSSFLAYIAGLVATIIVMVVFKHPQPALLYLVPACIGVPLLVALVKGDLPKMFVYSEDSSEDTAAEAKEETSKKDE